MSAEEIVDMLAAPIPGYGKFCKDCIFGQGQVVQGVRSCNHPRNMNVVEGTPNAASTFRAYAGECGFHGKYYRALVSGAQPAETSGGSERVQLPPSDAGRTD